MVALFGYLTIIWVGFLGVCFEVAGGGGGGVKLPPCPKFVKIMLETTNLAPKYTRILVSEEIPFSTKALLILLMSTFFW